MADEDPDQPDGGEDQPSRVVEEREGSRVAQANRVAAERVRSNPPPVISQQPAPPPQAPPAQTEVPEAPRGRFISTATAPGGEAPTVPAAATPAAETPPTTEKAAGQDAQFDALVEAVLKRIQSGTQGQPATATTGAEPAAETRAAGFNEPELEQQARADAAADADCVDLANRYNANLQRLGQLVKYNQRGVPTGGELVDLQRKIEKIGGYLDPSGVEVEGLELAEDQKDDLKRKLDNLEGQRNRFLTEIHRLENDNERLSDRYDRRLDQFRAQRHQDEVAKVRGKQREDQEATDERLGRQEWRLAIDQTTQGLSKDDADWLDRQLLLEADVVLDNGGEIPDFAAWMKLAAVPYLARVANTAGSRDATLARLKQRDAYQPAPRGDQAHAVTQDLSNLSPRERRRMIDRDVGRKSRDLLYRPTG